jgi:hypothetical protein
MTGREPRDDRPRESERRRTHNGVMSTAEPFMPAHWPSPRDRAAELDVDTDVDVFYSPGGEEEGTELPELARTPVFRTPTPGAGLTAEELSADMNAEQPTKTADQDPQDPGPSPASPVPLDAAQD